MDLAKTPFILQKRVDLVPERIASLLKQGKRQDAVQAVIKLYELLAKRTEKGFTDERQCFSINYGFCGNEALQIDIGRLVYKKEMPERELERLSNNLQEWVFKHFPEIGEECKEKLL